MAWIAEDTRRMRLDAGQPLLTDALKKQLETVFFPRYPTKRACLLPALHLVQHEYGHIDPAALREVAEFLEVSPAEAFDTATFYEEYWLQPKGKYLVAVCRSLACEIVGAQGIIDKLLDKLELMDVGESTDDGRFTVVALECLGSCGTAPVALVNDVLHEDITAESITDFIDGLPDDPHDYKDPSVDFEVPHDNPPNAATVHPVG
ncbi:MAG: NAD(P)H-dependent oxidoreductase subunit E [Planctomycetota bacterium]